MTNSLLRFFPFLWILSVGAPAQTRQNTGVFEATITPATAGPQFIRTSVPLPRGLLHEGETLLADDGHRKLEVAVRALSWHITNSFDRKSIRRAMVSFPYTFRTAAPAHFSFRPARPKAKKTSKPPIEFEFIADKLVVKYAAGPVLNIRLIAPARTSTDTPRREVVESNAFYRWERIHLTDSHWPKVIEVRANSLGEVVVIGHLQRNLPEDGRAPDFGWEIEGFTSAPWLDNGTHTDRSLQAVSHSYINGAPCTLHFDADKYCLYHPAAPLKRRGRSEAQGSNDGRVVYRYWRCLSDEKVPMQSTAWHRAELVIAPATLAHLTPSLQSPHHVDVDIRLWDQLYSTREAPDLKSNSELAAILKYHHEAIIHSMAQGDDMGNLTGYTDGQATGGVFGMNRLNHCPPIFQEAWRTGDRRLLETGLLWCENFYDQSIWWGEKQHGGTRYNNVIAQRRTPPDNDQTYMWRSNDSVNFCTKGYDSFWLAYEETGDPRMLEALEAQVAYAREHVHADKGECRNIGDVREFIRLYRCTGQTEYLDHALRLFRELRTKLSTGSLFDQGGKSLSPELSFIDDDEAGMKFGYAKPYIIGYALTGLPELAPLVPNEPRLREVIAAVADFLADSEDPLGGWRYPHPRSSYLILSQGIEHAWQLVQADRLLGAQEKHLDAIERVLRQRILGWQRTGKIFSGLNGWEMATGKIKERAELYQLYKKPEDRDFTRDYRDGEAGFGSSAPEGLVYFPEVLAFYLQHRPASRVLAPPKPDEPLGQVLVRAKEKN